MMWIFSTALFAAIGAHADFLFEHSLGIGKHQYQAIIILPQSYERFFGAWEEVDVEIAAQKKAPVANEVIQAKKALLQSLLWATYEKAPFLANQKLSEFKFRDFRFGETFLDGRSAIFAILKKSDNPGEPPVLRALIRSSSRARTFSRDPLKKSLRYYLPWELRGLRSEQGAEIQRQARSPIQLDFRKAASGITPIFGSIEQPLAAHHPDELLWFYGPPVELKAWFHAPEVVEWQEGGTTERRVLDFIPDLLAIVQRYGGFERTDLPLSSFQFGPEADVLLANILQMVSEALGRPLAQSDLGARAQRYFTELVDPALAEREKIAFGMRDFCDFGDPDFTGEKCLVLSGERETFFPALIRWAAERPGNRYLPMSRFIVEKNRAWCEREILQQALPILNAVPTGVGFSLQLR